MNNKLIEIIDQLKVFKKNKLKAVALLLIMILAGTEGQTPAGLMEWVYRD